MEVMKDDELLKSQYSCMALLDFTKTLVILFVQLIALVFALSVVMFVFCLTTCPKSFVVTIVSMKFIHLLLVKEVPHRLFGSFPNSFRLALIKFVVIRLEFI